MRQIVLPRKGAPSTPPVEDDGARSPDSRDDGAETPDTVTCPQCGCEFDPADAESDAAPDAATAKGTKGAALEIDAGPADAQAPIGSDAVTKALAAVLGASHGGA